MLSSGGADVIMASDLVEAGTAGIRVQACGDANIASFDIFVSPERRLVFDICDFDETLPAPWDYDVRRLMAGIEICSRDRGFSRGERIRILNHAAASTADQLLESTAEQNEYVQIQNGKFYAQAWNAIQQYVYTALHGGALQPGKSRDERVMIASCTDGGFPYGITWEEMGIDPDLSLEEKMKKLDEKYQKENEKSSGKLPDDFPDLPL